VKSQYLEWKKVASQVPSLRMAVTQDFKKVRDWFNNHWFNNQPNVPSLKIGSKTFFRRDVPPHFQKIAGVGTDANPNDWYVWISKEAVDQTDDMFIRTLLEEDVHWFRMKSKLAPAMEVGVGHKQQISIEERAVGQITEDLFQVGRERGWW